MKHLFAAIVIALTTFSSFAQYSTKGFGFQGYAIDSEGKSMSSTGVTVKFTLSPAIGTGLTYSEEHSITTDAYGVFSATVGGTGSTGNTGGPFSVLNFVSVNYKLKVEVKKTVGGSYTTVSEEALNAVPYARAAENGVPVGTIVAFAGETTKVPAGWVLCNGAQQDGSAAEWKQLYDAIGTAWGGSGSNFNLPDLRGRFTRGVDDAAGNDPDKAARTASASGGNTGNKVGTLQGDVVKAHTHNVSGSTATDGAHSHTDNQHARADNDDNDGIGEYIGGRGGNYNNGGGDGFIRPGGSAHSHAFNVNSASVGGNETRPVNAAVHYIIKK